MKSDNMLKIIWRGYNSIIIKPKLDQALEELSQYTTVGETVEHIPVVKNTYQESRVNPEDEYKILELVQVGEKIQAIKLAREVYGFDLKEAKEFVEELQAEEG